MAEEDQNTENDETLPMGRHDGPFSVEVSGERYEILSKIGKGGFGEVHLAHDKALDRPVAVKIINRSLMRGSKESILEEGRTLAQFEHPSIVSVYDVGEKDGKIFFVSQFIDGKPLHLHAQEKELSPEELAGIIAKIAEALDFAHSRSVVHRDITPGNILVTDDGDPFLIDFGIALSVQFRVNREHGGMVVGTPGYMSPEQARGEGHLVDGRSDIYSLGVILFELLVGTKPFEGSQSDMIKDVASLTMEVRPPRQIDHGISRSLERICLKALAKRTADRYSTAADFAEDLRSFVRSRNGSADPGTHAFAVPTVVPKGLRAFDESDSDFFLQLLPGLRDRNGIPESIRFWERAIVDQDDPFRVGVIYGPSGSGKSSFLKAGLIPRLPDEMEVIFLSADRESLEETLLERLRDRFGFDEDVRLAGAIRGIREAEFDQGAEGKSTGKVLIVLDQFEQWLHARNETSGADLISALRQSDGKHVQVLITLRDDFWMGISHLMDDIDVSMEKSRNVAAVDLFDLQHATLVLKEFGLAYGRIEKEEAELGGEWENFVSAALGDMEQDGKIVPLRLALFAEMSKYVEWTKSSYRELGGVQAIGVEFLESSFSSREASPAQRAVEKEARSILKALLPSGKSIIRGKSMERRELMAEAGIEHEDRFRATLKILDSELRLITPVDPESESASSEPRYMLTHDFLVEAIRLWLSRKEKASLSGRSAIRLSERAELWSARKERKQLPSAIEWIGMVLFTRNLKKSQEEATMLRAASKHHLLKFSAAALVVFGFWGVFSIAEARLEERRLEAKSEDLVEELQQAEFEFLPEVIEEMVPLRPRWEARVLELAGDDSATEEDRIRAHLALATEREESARVLVSRLRAFDADSISVLREELLPWKDKVVSPLWEAVLEERREPLTLLNGASLLASYDPGSDSWGAIAEDLVTTLAKADPLSADSWADALMPVRARLVFPAAALSRSKELLPAERGLASSLAVRFGLSDETLFPNADFVDLILQSDEEARKIFRPTVEERWAVVSGLFREKARVEIPLEYGVELDDQLFRKANAIETLFLQGVEDPLWQALGEIEDPRLRSILSERIAILFQKSGEIIQTLQAGEVDRVRARQALVMGLSEFGSERGEERQLMLEFLSGIFFHDPDSGMHSSAAWALRKLGYDEPLDLSPSATYEEGRNWRVTGNGVTMVKIMRPGLVIVGSPEAEPGRDTREKLREVVFDYDFEVSAHEITLEQYHQFRADFPYSVDITQSKDCPMTRLNLFEALRFCRWMSENDPSIDLENCCYPPMNEIKEGMLLPEGFHRKPGYRLLLSEEWEYVCRAGTKTARFFGNSEALLPLYSFAATNSKERVWPVGSLRPNPFGLFDLHGNVDEWTHRHWSGLQHEEILRGGNYRSTNKFLRSASPPLSSPNANQSYKGMRIARILQAQ